MTPEKALKIFNHEVYADGAEKAEANRVIREALGKQIAVKPQENYNWCDLTIEERLETPHWFCPECREELLETENYCPECGQKLDWSDEE